MNVIQRALSNKRDEKRSKKFVKIPTYWEKFLEAYYNKNPGKPTSLHTRAISKHIEMPRREELL